MKKLSLALNVILTIAVVILYYFQFTKDATKISNEKENNAVQSSTTNPSKSQEEGVYTSKIGYINVDSLQLNYGLYDELKAKLEAKQNRYEKDLAAKSKAFQRKVTKFQKKAPTMSQFEGELKQKELGKEQQELYKLENQYSTKFQDELLKLNKQLYKSIKDFVNQHNKEKYDIIIGESQTRNFVLDVNQKIDITNEIIDGLNEQYNLKNKKSKTK